jgi:Phage tail protein
MKNPNNFKVVRQNGEIYDMATNGIIVNSFIPQSPAPYHVKEKVDDRNGYIDLGTTYEGKTIKSTITVLAVDGLDYPFIRNEIFKLFDSKEFFYILPDEEPGKRYRVKYDSPYSLSRQGLTGTFSISFTSDLSFSESIGTTLDDFTLDSNLWQIGQGLIADELIYKHYTNSFEIFNAGDVEIDPRELPLKISFKGKSTNLTIMNKTTGDSVTYTGVTIAGDTFTLDGVQILKNGSSVFGNTNRKIIRLAAGWNEFTITGTEDPFEILFDFRFYYL